MRHSLSKYGTFTQCPAKYKYRYVDQLPQKQHAAAARGTDMHLSMELFTKGEMQALPSDLSHYESFIRNLQKIPGALVIPEEKIYVNENWQACETSSAWVTSVLDLTVVAGPVLAIYDWKTGKVYDDHINQKELYSIMGAAKHAGISRIEAYHVYLDKNKTTKITYEISDLDGLKKKWENNFKTLEYTTEFIPTPSFLCRYCDYRRENGGPCPF